MINHLVNKFRGLERDINALSYVLLFLIVLLSVRVMVLLYEQEYKDLWTILRPIVSSFAALLVAKTASRLITNNNLIREDDRKKDLVRVTHHLLAIVNDLRSRVHYLQTMLKGNRPVLVLGKLASSIERRYETLLERDAYQYLPGPTVDLIVSMSGTVFGITTLAAGLEKASDYKGLESIDSILPPDRNQQISSLERLSNDLEKLLDHIYELRASIDHKEIAP